MKSLLKTSSLFIAILAFAAMTFVSCDKASIPNQSEVSEDMPFVIGAKKDGNFEFKNKATLKPLLEEKFRALNEKVQIAELSFEQQKTKDGQIFNVVLAKDKNQITTYGMILDDFEGDYFVSRIPPISCTSNDCDQGQCVPYVASTVVNPDGTKTQVWDCTGCDWWETCKKKSVPDSEPVPGGN